MREKERGRATERGRREGRGERGAGDGEREGGER